MSELRVMIALVSLLLACFGALKIKSFMSWRDTFLGIGAIFIGFLIVCYGDSTMFTGVMIEMFIIASMTLVAFRLIHMRWGMENYDSVRYYRITMNRKQKIILAIVLVTLIGGLFGLSYWTKHNRNIKNTRNQSQIMSDSAKFKSEYPRVAANNRFVYASDKEVLNIFDSGSGVVFLGFPQCPWCQHLSEYVDRAARAEGVDKIYYLNIRDARASNNEVYQKLVKKLEPYLDKDDNGKPRIFVPDVSIVKNGKIIGRYKEESNGDDNITPDKYWTSERIERTSSQLRGFMRQLKG